MMFKLKIAEKMHKYKINPRVPVTLHSNYIRHQKTHKHNSITLGINLIPSSTKKKQK